MGLSGISKSTVSKLCKDIGERVGEFLNRPLAGDWPYVWLDATYLKQRQGGRIFNCLSTVSSLIPRPKRCKSRSAGRPPVACPRWPTISPTREVRRANGRAIEAIWSENVRRGQAGA